MEAYLNLLHFCFYQAHRQLRLWFDKINPAHLLYRLPVLKSRYEKRGVNMHQEMDHVFALGESRSEQAAGAALAVMIGLVLFAVLLRVDQNMDSKYLFVCFLFGFVIAYCLVFRNEKYLAYFERYGKWSRGEKIAYSGVTLASVAAMFLLFRWALPD